jgi:hypothetical protein
MAYWRKIAKRAWRDTAKALRIETREGIVIFLGVQAIIAVIIWYMLGQPSLVNNISNRLATVAAPFLMFPLLFAWNFLTGPAKLDAQLQTELDSIKSKAAKLRVHVPSSHHVSGREVWTVSVDNLGPATADAVQMELIEIVPPPSHWETACPQKVVIDGALPRAPDRTIHTGNSAVFNIFYVHPSTSSAVIGNMNTRNSREFTMDMMEQWTATYRVSAANAERIQFSVLISQRRAGIVTIEPTGA